MPRARTSSNAPQTTSATSRPQQEVRERGRRPVRRVDDALGRVAAHARRDDDARDARRDRGERRGRAAASPRRVPGDGRRHARAPARSSLFGRRARPRVVVGRASCQQPRSLAHQRPASRAAADAAQAPSRLRQAAGPRARRSGSPAACPARASGWSGRAATAAASAPRSWAAPLFRMNGRAPMVEHA